MTKNYDSLNDIGIGLIDAVTPFSPANPPRWGDGVVFPVGTAFGTPAAGIKAVPYFFPSSPTGRAVNAPLPAALRPGIANDAQIFKLQYQRNWEHSYFRAFGYSFFSDWLQNNPVYGALGGFTFDSGGPSRDYELITHTHGGGLQFANQITNQHQLIATLNYSTAKPTRLNNSTFTNALTTPATNYTDGTNCYRIATGAPNTCYSGTTSGTFGNPTPALGAGVAVPGASFQVTDPGPRGTSNAVVPKFTTASLTDEWRPNERTVLNFGLRMERFEYDRPSTDTPEYKFWFNQVANAYCYDLKTGQPLIDPQPPQFVADTPKLHLGYNNTCGPAGPGPTGHIDPATGDPVGNPNGKFGTLLYTGHSSGNLIRSVFEPRLGGTYTFNPDTVVRFSAGVYSQPFNTATVQYTNLSAKSAANDDFKNFFGFGFTSPSHDFNPSKSYNVDASLERHIRGTDMSFKISPFYRYVKDQYQDFFIGPGFVSAVPTGNETAYGLEVQWRKGDPSRDGLSGQLSYTYTNAFYKFNRFSNGTTVVTPVNNTIDQFNALTSAGSRAGQTGAPCYVGGAPAPAGMCTPSGGANNTPALTAAGAAYVDGNGNQVVINPYYNMHAQSYYDEGGVYPVYQNFPGINGATGLPDPDQSIVEPHAFSGFVNWKKDRFSVGLAGTMAIGAPGARGFSNYGNPYTAVGVDPRSCSNNQTNVPTAPNPGQPNWISCGPSLGQYGSLYIPNPQTGQFDGIGAFRQPWLLNLNAQMSYALSKDVRATVVLANLFNRCFGGSNTPWSSAFPAGARSCGYTPNANYVSNFYNGSSPNDVAANGVGSYRVNQQSYAPFYPFSPFQATLQLQVKL